MHPSDSCRICKFSFKVNFGNVCGKQFYSLSQNLFKRSQRKDSFGNVLADVCKQVGLVLLADSQEYSDRVCNSCTRKILTLGNLFEIVKTASLVCSFLITMFLGRWPNSYSTIKRRMCLACLMGRTRPFLNRFLSMVTSYLKNIWTYRDAVNEYEWLQGMDTEFADWHAKYTLYKVTIA